MIKNKVSIIGTGSYLPGRILTNDELIKTINSSSEWIVNNLGISERRIVVNELPSDMALKASLLALEAAKLDKEDLDLIIVATSSGDQISPSTACILNNKLKLTKNIPSFDIAAVCSGFLYAMSISSALINNGTYNNILIVGTEAYSRFTDWNNRNAVFFGDGAGAIILSTSENGWISSELNSNGGDTGITGFSLKHNDTFVTNPKEVWNQAISVVPKSIESILTQNNMSINDIDLFIPHQASFNMLKLIANTVNLPIEKIKTVMNKYGNIAGASIPIVLDEIIKNGEVKENDTLLLSAIGSGWVWGSMIIKYSK